MLLLLQAVLTNFKFCGIINKKEGYSIMARNNEEEFLYNLMAKMYEVKAPVIFKGAMILKAVQNEYGNPTGLVRETHDIDGDWIGETPSMEDLQSILQRAVDKIETTCTVTVKQVREYGEKQSAGFEFVEEDGNVLTTMDLSIKNNKYYKLYEIDGVYFLGQTIEKILVDKIYVCSTKKVYRRIKDVIDLYILSYCWKGSYQSLLTLSKDADREFEAFTHFTENFSGLEHAYSKYHNSASGGDFREVYKRVFAFLAPFIMHYDGKYYWDSSVWVFKEGV